MKKEIFEQFVGPLALTTVVLKKKPQNFEKIKEEALSLACANDGSDVTAKKHGTYWTKPFGVVRQYNLFQPEGKYDDFKAFGLSVGHEMYEKDLYPNLNRFLTSIGPCVNARLNIMGPNSGLNQHKETTLLPQGNGKTGIKVRVHLPIQTNKHATVFVSGEVYHLEEGKLYYFNNGCIHAAHNKGSSGRLHLVFDLLLTKDLYEDLFEDYDWPELLGTEPIDSRAPVDMDNKREAKNLDWFDLKAPNVSVR